MAKNRKDLLQNIKSLQQLIPGDNYGVYIKQAQLKYLDFIPDHRFLPAMNDNSPKSLNDVELNVLSKSKQNYLNNIFIPTVVEKQAEILIGRQRETKDEAVERWTETIKKVGSPDELIKVINSINHLKKSKGKKKQKKSFWQKLFG